MKMCQIMTFPYGIYVKNKSFNEHFLHKTKNKVCQKFPKIHILKNIGKWIYQNNKYSVIANFYIKKFLEKIHYFGENEALL